MDQLLKDAGHNKFERDEVLYLEQRILKSLAFKVQCKNAYEEAVIKLKTTDIRILGRTNKENLHLLFKVVPFIGTLALHSALVAS